jgi:hypothetical protein
MIMDLMGTLKIKRMILLFLMLKLNMIIIIMKKKNYLKLIEDNNIIRMMKKMKLVQEMILNLQTRRTRRRNIHQHKVKRGTHGFKYPYHILKR